MLIWVAAASAWLSCSGEESALPPPPDVERPLSTSVAILKIHHRSYPGHELFIDGEPRGELPVDAVLTHGMHRFEVQTGPGNRLRIDRLIEPGQGIRFLELGEP